MSVLQVKNKYFSLSAELHQIYTHLNNVFELLSKAVVESKQKVNIPKLSKEEPEEKEESEKAKREEKRGAGPSNPIFISSRMHNSLKKKLWVHLKWMGSQNARR